MADSTPLLGTKTRLKKYNFSREEIVLIQREVEKKEYHHKFKALKYNYKRTEKKSMD